MSKEAFEIEVNRWRLLAEAVLKEAETLPHLGPQAAELAALVARLNELHAHRIRLQGEMAVAVRQIRDGRDQGRDLCGRLQAGLKQVYGVHSRGLYSFGGRPRRQSRRRGAGDEPEPGAEVPS